MIIACNNYKLLGNTTISDVAIVESDNNAIKLSYMGLCYLNECRIMEHYKRNLLKGDSSCKMDLCKYYVPRKWFCV